MRKGSDLLCLVAGDDGDEKPGGAAALCTRNGDQVSQLVVLFVLSESTSGQSSGCTLRTQ